MTPRPQRPSEAEMPALLRAWLRADIAELPDGGELPGVIRNDVLRRLDEMPQRHHRWLGRWLGRGQGATRSAEHHGSDRDDRRNRLMFSASAVAAGVATLALVATIVVPRGAPEPGVAPADAPSPSPAVAAGWAAVTGTSTCNPATSMGEVNLESPPYGASGPFACYDASSDPRVTGIGTLTYNARTWDERSKASGWGAAYNATMWADMVIMGPGGRWTGRIFGLYDNDGDLHNLGILAGSGGYEGLTYTFTSTVPLGSVMAQVTGVIEPGPPPPDFPVTPATASGASSK